MTDVSLSLDGTGIRRKFIDNADGSYTERVASAIDQTTPGTTNGVVVAGSGIIANASFTPTAVSYTAGNIIDTAKQFAFTYAASGLAVPSGSMIRILTSVLKIDASAAISGEVAYTAHAYDITPPSARANNAAWTRASGDLTAYRGPLALGTPGFAGTGYIKTQLSDQQDLKLLGTSLWLELINAGTFTGAAVARQVFLYGIVL